MHIKRSGERITFSTATLSQSIIGVEKPSVLNETAQDNSSILISMLQESTYVGGNKFTMVPTTQGGSNRT